MSTPEEKAARRRLAPLVVLVAAGGFMTSLDASFVNAGLETIAGTLNASLSEVEWVTRGYWVASAAALPAAPLLQRRVGASRLWRWSLLGLMATSLLCALAPSVSALVAARVVQGACGGLLLLVGQRLVAEAAGPQSMGRVMSIVGLAIVVAAVVGPALGGLLVDEWSWRWLFLANLLIGGLATVCAWRILPDDVSDRSARLDVLGLALPTAGLPMVLLGLGQPGASAPSDHSGQRAAAGALLLLAFLIVTSSRGRGRVDRPAVLDLSLFRRRHYAAAQATVFFAALSLVGGSVLLPRCYETFCGLSEGSTNCLLLAFGVGAVVTIPVAGCLSDHFGDGAICVLGLTILTLATCPFVFLSANSDFATVQILQALHGVGVGLTAIPSMTAAFRAAPGDLADATAAANILGRFGGSLGSALVAILVARTYAPLAGFQRAQGLLVGTAFCALLTAAVCARAERREQPRPHG